MMITFGQAPSLFPGKIRKSNLSFAAQTFKPDQMEIHFGKAKADTSPFPDPAEEPAAYEGGRKIVDQCNTLYEINTRLSNDSWNGFPTVAEWERREQEAQDAFKELVDLVAHADRNGLIYFMAGVRESGGPIQSILGSMGTALLETVFKREKELNIQWRADVHRFLYQQRLAPPKLGRDAS